MMKMIWKIGSTRSILVAAMVRMLFILLVSLSSTWGFIPLDPTRFWPLPVLDNPDDVVIAKGRTPDEIVRNLSYVEYQGPVLDGSQPLSPSFFGGCLSWEQREESFKLSSSMKVNCGFMRDRYGGADMDPVDIEFVKKCRFVVVSGIFDGYTESKPYQPSKISSRSKELFCFLMVVDEAFVSFLKGNTTRVREDSNGGQWVGIWRLVILRNLPYKEPEMNEKVAKILTHRLFPQTQYSIWVDATMELVVDPLLILERYLWRGKNTFAISQHKFHRSIYQEAYDLKWGKQYSDRRVIDLHMKIYSYEGMQPWSSNKTTLSDVPEGDLIIREHTAMNNLFSCLWFNEVNIFTPNDQLSFGYVLYRLGDSFKLFMFPNWEYRRLFVSHRHTPWQIL